MQDEARITGWLKAIVDHKSHKTVETSLGFVLRNDAHTMYIQNDVGVYRQPWCIESV